MRKKNIISFLILILALFAGGLVKGLTVNGFITDISTGLPVGNHTVFILVDESGSQGFSYFSQVTTDQNGYYADSLFLPPGHPLTLLVRTFDCLMTPLQQFININQQHYTFNFQVCTPLTGCHAWFSSHNYHSNPLRITFFDFSVGNIDTWLWDFGDGNSTFQSNPVHMYGQPGTYIVSLTVSHTNPNLSCNSTYTDTIQVGISPTPCLASFNAWTNLANPMKWHFQQQSTGIISQWRWDFGDGATGMGQNAMHVYADTGLYQVCHYIQGPQCQDTFCDWIQVSSPGDYNVAGQVFTGFFPADAAEVMLFRKLEGKYYLVQTTDTDSLGIYYFYQIIGGQYIIRAHLKPQASHYGNYIPSYHPASPFWFTANEMNLYSNKYNANISLAPHPIPLPGPGSISGDVFYDDKKGKTGPAADVEVLLLNTSNQPVAATYSHSDGSFSFPGIPFGAYIVHAEVPGIPTQVTQVVLNASQPVAGNISLEVQPMMVLAVQSSSLTKPSYLRIFPNPFHNSCFLEIYSDAPGDLRLNVTSLNGIPNQALVLSHPGGTITRELPFHALPAGLHIVRVVFPDGTQHIQKILKMN